MSWFIPARAVTCVKWSKKVCPSFHDVEDSPGKTSMLTLTRNCAASSTTRFRWFLSMAAKPSSTAWMSRNSCGSWPASSLVSNSAVSVTISSGMFRTQLYANPQNLFLHDVVLDSCRRNAEKTALVDASCGRRLTYAEYGEAVESLARGLIANGVNPGDVIAIFLANSWEFCVAYHAATLAGAIPTLLNPSYREREVRYQLENSGAVLLITDGGNIDGISLGGLPNLRRVYTTRQLAPGTEPFANLFHAVTAVHRKPDQSSQQTLAVLPYSSGTTGLPKGVMLSHYNLIANVYQF